MSKYDFDLDVFGDNTIAWIAKSVEESSRVLEFGPANGRLTKYLKEQKKCDVDIVEIDAISGADAKKYAVNALIGPNEGNIENYHWVKLGVKYDYIIFADVLEHLVNPDEVLKHCNVVIADAGKILVSVPNVSHNSILIGLLNDQFKYNPTGLLDNTHLRFFTRQSFGEMVAGLGWTIVEERAKQIRVGENEIKTSYGDVSKPMFKELVHRNNGDVYQYFFVLASSDDYLKGNVERVVSLDSSSYYYATVQYEHDGEFDYKKSAEKHYDPYYGYVSVSFPIINDAQRVKFMPINANAIIDNVRVSFETSKGTYEVSEVIHNGHCYNNVYYCLEEEPEWIIPIPDKTTKIKLEYHILNYDFEDQVYKNLLDNLLYEGQHITRVCNEYNQEIERREKEHEKTIGEKNSIIESLRDEIQILRETPIRKVADKLYSIVKQPVKRMENIVNPQVVTIEDKSNEGKIDQSKIKKVSAVIPNYNYARYLVERIDSILFQTYPISELIILDDCSTDNSLEVIQKYINEHEIQVPVSVIPNETNSGNVFAQWQKAFQVATGDYVWIAEADDSCNEHFLEKIMSGFDDPEVVMSYSESLTIDENNKLLMGDLRVWIDIFNTGKWDKDYVNDGVEEVRNSMCINNTIANVSSVVFKNDDYYDIIEGAKDYRLAGDWYVYMNILRRGKIAYFKDSLNYHRMQKQGLTLSTSHEKEFEEIVRLQDFAIYHFNVSDEMKKKVYERRERERIRFGL